MKSITFVCLLAFVSLALGRPERYTDRYDNINLNEILGNRRLLIPYIKCILDQGKCSPDGKELKEHVREALENDCEKCTDTQRSGSKRVIGHIINNEQDYWQQLITKYDPQKKYVARYENELKKIN